MKKKNDNTIGEALDMMVDELHLKEKLNESRIKQAWVEVVGQPIAKYTSSVTFRGGKLYLRIDSASLRQELNYSRENIKELFNKKLGGVVVTDVVIC